MCFRHYVLLEIISTESLQWQLCTSLSTATSPYSKKIDGVYMLCIQCYCYCQHEDFLYQSSDTGNSIRYLSAEGSWRERVVMQWSQHGDLSSCWTHCIHKYQDLWVLSEGWYRQFNLERRRDLVALREKVSEITQLLWNWSVLHRESCLQFDSTTNPNVCLVFLVLKIRHYLFNIPCYKSLRRTVFMSVLIYFSENTGKYIFKMSCLYYPSSQRESLLVDAELTLPVLKGTLTVVTVDKASLHLHSLHQGDFLSRGLLDPLVTAFLWPRWWPSLYWNPNLPDKRSLRRHIGRK